MLFPFQAPRYLFVEHKVEYLPDLLYYDLPQTFSLLVTYLKVTVREKGNKCTEW